MLFTLKTDAMGEEDAAAFRVGGASARGDTWPSPGRATGGPGCRRMGGRIDGFPRARPEFGPLNARHLPCK